MITSTPAATKLDAALTANPGHTTAELARLAGIGRSTAGKLLAAWHAEGHAFRGGTKGAPTWTSPASNAAAIADGAVDLTQPEPEPAPAVDAAPTAPEPAPRHLSVVRDAPATEPTDRIRAAHQDPTEAPRPGMVALTCGQCSAHVVWANPPAPAAPVRCAACADQPAPAPAPVRPEGKLAKGGLRAIVAAWLAANPSTEITPARLGRELDRSAGAVHNALETLCTRGGAVRTSDKPKTYRMAGDA